MRRVGASVALILLVVVLWSPSGLPAAEPTDWTAGVRPSKPADPVSGDFVPGQVIVKFKPWIPQPLVSALAAGHSMDEEDEIGGLGARLMTVSAGRELETVKKLSSNWLVEYAEPNYLQRLHFVPNDPNYLPEQWNLRIINMPQAWDISRGNAAVKVAVIDSGIDTSHRDRPVNLLSGYNFVSYSYDVYDRDGHGTFTSGIVAAAIDNGLGMASVAPAVTLVMYKEVNPATGGFPIYATSQAIANAANNGAKVINMSIGGPDYSATLQAAIDYAWGKGTLIVAAAGNCGAATPGSTCVQVNQVEYPAALPNVLAVGSTTKNDAVADHSTQNSYVDVSAPGQSIFSLGSPVPALGYSWKSGTSFASPHVAGLAGLIFSVNASLSNKQVGDIITSTAKDLGQPGRDDAYGYGRIDAYAALLAAGGSVPPTATPVPTVVPVDNARALSGPYNFTLDPGQQVTYKTRFQNTGTTWWRASDRYMLRELETGFAGALGSAYASGGCDGLAPWLECEWSWTHTAQRTLGTYSRSYRMYHRDAYFGDTITATFTVRTPPTATPTRTPTLTPTPTPTPARNLSQNGGTSRGAKVAADRGSVHVVWMDDTPGNDEIFHQRWNGSSWSQTENISQNSGPSRNPAVATDQNGNVHVVWTDDTPSYGGEILYRRWSGNAWSAIENVSQTSGGWSGYPAVASDSQGKVHVVWQDTGSGADYEILYRFWDGTRWSQIESASRDTGGSPQHPALAVAPEGDVHVVWTDTRRGNDVLYQRRSGTIWSQTENLSQSNRASEAPAVAADSAGNVHVVWMGTTPGNYEVLYRRWNGTAWSATENLSQNAGASQSPEVAVDASGNAHVVWDDSTTGNVEILYRRWNGSAWSVAENLSWNSGYSGSPAVAIDAKGSAHVVWNDRTTGNSEILYANPRVPGVANSTPTPSPVPAATSSPTATATPVSPAEYSGSVTLNGAPAVDGLEVYAWVGAYRSRGAVTVSGRYRGLVVAPPAGFGSIEFYVDGVRANETDTFVAGSVKSSFNLTVGSTPTPTNTPVPSATLTHTPTTVPTPVPTGTVRAATTVTPTATRSPSSQVQLAKGWTFMSLPRAPEDPSLGAIFGDVPAVARVNTFQDGNWVSAMRGAGGWSGPLTQMVDGKAYWVYATEATILPLRPKLPDPLAPPPSYALTEGWSMIGYTSSVASMPVETYLSSLQGKWLSLYRYEEENGWEVARPGGVGFGQVERGKGYWIYLNAPGTLVP